MSERGRQLRAGVGTLAAVVVGLSSGLSGCGSSSAPAAAKAAGCSGDASQVGLYVAFATSGTDGYTEGFDSGLSGCQQYIGTGVADGIAINQVAGLDALGVYQGAAQVRAINNLDARGNTSFDAGQDYLVLLSSVTTPAGMLLQGLGGMSALVVMADATPANGQSASSLPGLHAGILQVLGNGGTVTLTNLTQKQTGAATTTVAYDANDDILFAARIDGVVDVFDHFELDVAAGVAPPLSRTITPGALSGTNSAQISGTLHGLAYDAASDTLVIADADNAALYVVAHAASAEDTAPSGAGPAVVVPDRIVSGDATMLEQPNDVLLSSDGALYVADQGSGGKVLRFDGFLLGSDSAPVPDAVGKGQGGVPTYLAQP